MLVVLTVAGLGAVVAGSLAYTGRWRNWAYRSSYLQYGGFSLVYFGAGIAWLGLAAIIGKSAGLVEATLLVWGPLVAVSPLTCLWLPGFLLPRWFREGRDQRRLAERRMWATRPSGRRRG